MIYENGVWSHIDGAQIKAKTEYNALDFMNVAVNPNDKNHFFVTSYGTGLYEFKNNEFSTWYNNTNSTLYNIYPTSYQYIRIDGAIFDKDLARGLNNFSLHYTPSKKYY